MMVYLPIAEMPVNVLLVLLVSGVIGFVSGLVGVGGGFIMTPSLIFLGIPAPVAVATGASHFRSFRPRIMPTVPATAPKRKTAVKTNNWMACTGALPYHRSRS
jgi:hypothetical protein